MCRFSTVICTINVFLYFQELSYFSDFMAPGSCTPPPYFNCTLYYKFLDPPMILSIWHWHFIRWRRFIRKSHIMLSFNNTTWFEKNIFFYQSAHHRIALAHLELSIPEHELLWRPLFAACTRVIHADRQRDQQERDEYHVVRPVIHP